MKNERQFITIKGWFLNKTQATASAYKCFINIYNRDENGIIPENTQVLVEEVIAESEKAVQVRLATGEIDGSAKGWKTWLPKSVIVA